ncbi:MAG: hypothetical protein PHN98_01750 [Smithellaceae bacterium]|nr:hypothetical protein [Smithellaceae bacterium]
MSPTTIPISPTGRIVCMAQLDIKIREIRGEINYYLATVNPSYVDREWIAQRRELVRQLSEDLQHLRDD